MDYLFKKTGAALIDFRLIEELTEETYLAGKNEASKWFEKADLEQIKRILSNHSFLEYVENNDVNYIYDGVINELSILFDEFDDGCDTILKEDFDNHFNVSNYIIFDLMMKYHEGFKDAVREKCRGYADAIVSCDNQDKESKNDDSGG